MILSKTVKIRANPSNIVKFRNLNYDMVYGKETEIKVEHLSEGSNVIIKVKCDVCGKESDISYKVYLKNVKKYDLYTCQSCKHIKAKKHL